MTQRSKAGERLGRFLPSAPRGFGDQALLDHTGCDPDALHLTIGQDDANLLEVGEEATLGGRGDVRTDAALLLRFTTAPDVAALDGAGAGQFANSCHK